MSKKIPAKLQQKMAQSVVGTAPSLIPPTITSSPTPPETEEGPITLDDLIGDSEDLETLRALIKQQVPLNAEKHRLDRLLNGSDGKSGINGRIKNIIKQYGTKISGMCEGMKVDYFPTTRRSIDPLKLLAAGVTQDTIDLCTDQSTSYTLKIT